MLWIHQSFKTYVFGFAGGVGAFDDIGQRNTQPGNDHRPCLNAAQAVNALFKLRGLGEVLQGKAPAVIDLAIDHHAPGLGFQAARMAGRVALVGAEFEKVVVATGVIKGGNFIFVRIARGDGSPLGFADFLL